jgi:hypothetical protein
VFLEGFGSAKKMINEDLAVDTDLRDAVTPTKLPCSSATRFRCLDEKIIPNLCI